MSIRGKVSLIVLVLLALLGLMFALYSHNTTENYKRLRIEGVTATVRLAAERVNNTIATMERNVVDLANNGRTLLSSEKRGDEIGEGIVVENFDSFAASVGGGIWYEPGRFRAGERRVCFYAQRRGGALGRVEINPEFRSEKYDYFTQSWYREIAAAVKERHTVAWTRPYYDDTGSFALMTTVGSGIFDRNEQFAGMATVDWEIDSVIETLKAIKPTPNSFILLAVPSRDYVITNTSDGSSGGAASEISWYRGVNVPLGDEVSIDTIPYRGGDHLAFSQGMDNGWLICAVIPRGEIFSEVEQLNRRYSAVLILAALALLGAAWWLLSHLVSRPVARFIRDVEELGRGNLEVRMDASSGDEIGRLGAAFNRMTGDLRDSMARSAVESAERERLVGELGVAARMQSGMAPGLLPSFPGRNSFDVFGGMAPAKEVGGTFYDYFMVDGSRCLCVVIADVAGRGVSAALLAVISRTLIKNNAQSGLDVGEVFSAVNAVLGEDGNAGMLVTAFMGFLDVGTGDFRYASAGHRAPMICRAGQSFNELHVVSNPELGVGGAVWYTEGSLRMEEGDTIFLYTNGVVEAEGVEGSAFGVDRCRDSLDERRGMGLEDLLAGVRYDIDVFSCGVEQADDITMLALRMGAKAPQNSKK